MTGEGLDIKRKALREPGNEAELPMEIAGGIADRIYSVASRYESCPQSMYLHAITRDSLRSIQERIDENGDLLR